jgi:hypothetical protein
MNYIQEIVDKVERALIRAAFTGERQHVDTTAWDITVEADLSSVVWKRKPRATQSEDRRI